MFPVICGSARQLGEHYTHHRSDHPADIDGIRSALSVHLGVSYGVFGVVQDFETDVHHIVLKLKESQGD